MARIKKRGLDYFPLDTQFVNHRTVRRLMKRLGESSMAVLIHLYSAIYAGEGYYIEVDDELYDDIADRLFTLDADDVRRVVELAVEFGLFHRELFERQRVLTSEGIQRQYLFSTRRRHRLQVDRYNLLPPEELAAAAPAETGAETPENVTEMPKTVAKTAQMPLQPSAGTHSIAQQSTEQHSKAQPPHPAPPTAGVGKEEAVKGHRSEGKSVRPLYTQADIDALTAPADGLPRNLDGLRLSLKQWNIPYAEQYAIVLRSNFGAIGHPLWQGFYTLRSSKGKIRQPGKFLLSLCGMRQEEGG